MMESTLPHGKNCMKVSDLGCNIPDTYAPWHMAVSAGGAGKVAEQAEQAKCLTYSALESKFFFVPIAIKSSGVSCPKAYTFLNDLGRHLMSVTMDSQACYYLFQLISVAVQRGKPLQSWEHQVKTVKTLTATFVDFEIVIIILYKN